MHGALRKPSAAGCAPLLLVSLLHYMLDSIYNCLQNGRCQSPGCKNLHRRDSTAKKMEEETEDAATTYHKRLDTELTRDKK